MMNNIQSFLANILTSDSDNLFCIFSNTDGKQWIMPIKNMRTAMNLYQPCGVKGKLMKKYFPTLWKIKPLQTKLGIKFNRYALQADLKNILCKIFATENPEFSLFCGTPSKHQKITMQISHEKNILGYCKFSDNGEVNVLFLYEQAVLNTLQGKKIESIPECLYYGALNNNISVFVQSTAKTNKSKVIHEWTNEHWRFLSDLKQKTEQTLLFEQTDFFQDIQLLQQNLSCLSFEEQANLNKAINKVLSYYKDSTVVFSFYHGDFTPWNTFCENERLFVFDWEYARMTYPPYLDWFHFFTQCCIFERHFQAEEIYRFYLQKKATLINHIENPDFLYLCYLLHIISFYLKRESGDCNGEIKNSLNIWLKIIRLLDQ